MPKALDPQYFQRLDELAVQMQSSEELARYHDTEEEEDYKAFTERFEPMIAELYGEVAQADPLQLESLETTLLHEAFEGAYLPKILGFAVLRGELNADYKYVRPQPHFKQILLNIVSSPNFEYLRKRIGQTIKTGFAFSSDIWITDLINQVENRRLRYYLQNLKELDFRDKEVRERMHKRYQLQFKEYNFLAAEFPTTPNDLTNYFYKLREFLIHRAQLSGDNSALYEPIGALLENEALYNHREYTHLLGVLINFYDLSDELQADAADVLARLRKEDEDFEQDYFEFLLEMHQRADVVVDRKADQRVLDIIDLDIDDELTKYYSLVQDIHTKGFTNEEVMAGVRAYSLNYKGLAINNELVRRALLVYFAQVLDNLDESEYGEYFELNKTLTGYMEIFGNENFNQAIKSMYMRYVKRLKKKFTDKRAKDYQSVKKFVSSTFVDLGFLTEKEVKKFFRTPRKPRTKA